MKNQNHCLLFSRTSDRGLMYKSCDGGMDTIELFVVKRKTKSMFPRFQK